MKATIVIVGGVRTLKDTLPSLRQHLFSKCDADVIVQCPSEDDSSMRVLMPEATVDAWDCPSEILSESGRNLLGSAGRSDFSFWVQLIRLYRVACVFSERLTRSPLVVKLRPDIFLMSQVDCSPVNDSRDFRVPTYNTFCGINDQIAVGGSVAMNRYMRRIERLPLYFACGGLRHPESYLAYAMKRFQPQRLSIAYTLLRESGMHYVTALEEWGDRVSKEESAMFQANGVTVVREYSESVHLASMSSLANRVKRTFSQMRSTCSLMVRLEKILRRVRE